MYTGVILHRDCALPCCGWTMVYGLEDADSLVSEIKKAKLRRKYSCHLCLVVKAITDVTPLRAPRANIGTNSYCVSSLRCLVIVLINSKLFKLNVFYYSPSANSSRRHDASMFVLIRTIDY